MFACTGTISSEDFLIEAQNFLKIPNLAHSWQLVANPDTSCSSYLFAQSYEKSLTTSLDGQGHDSSTAEDDANEVDSVIVARYSIVFSPSYSVPVLYFNKQTLSGELVRLEDLWRNIPASYAPDKQDLYSCLSQAEHPIFHRPFFTIHPCHTADLMKRCQQLNAVGTYFQDKDPLEPSQSAASKGYLLRWITSLAPMAGLNVLAPD